jgi:hypothetical protein
LVSIFTSLHNCWVSCQTLSLFYHSDTTLSFSANQVESGGASYVLISSYKIMSECYIIINPNWEYQPLTNFLMSPSTIHCHIHRRQPPSHYQSMWNLTIFPVEGPILAAGAIRRDRFPLGTYRTLTMFLNHTYAGRKSLSHIAWTFPSPSRPSHVLVFK